MPTRIQSLRNRAFKTQCKRCCYCGVIMWLASPAELPGDHRQASTAAARWLKCTAEHLKPRSEGGHDLAHNIKAACAHCNRTRHKRKNPPEPGKYRDEVQRRVKRGAWHPRWVYERGLLPQEM